MATPAKLAVKHVKPILSIDARDARRRVLMLYRQWYRQIPFVVVSYDIPKSEKDCKKKLREEFLRHAHVTDVRVIDLLVIKGQMKLDEISKRWITNGGLMHIWKETEEPKPTDFMSKFLSGDSTTI